MPPSTTRALPQQADQSPLPEAPLVERDVRRKRPPVLSFLLRLDSLRGAARIVTLLALDFAGVFLGILTALCPKAAAHDKLNFH